MVTSHTPLVGQFSKQQAADAYRRPLYWSLVSVILVVAACGFLVGFQLGKSLTVVYAIAVFMVALLLGSRFGVWVV